MVDIEINAWSSLFLNLETNLILYLYSKKCIKTTNQSRESEAGKFEFFARHLRLIYRNGRDSLNFEKSVFEFSVLCPKKSGLSKKSKVSTLDIRIKQSGLKVSHSKVLSSGLAICKVRVGLSIKLKFEISFLLKYFKFFF